MKEKLPVPSPEAIPQLSSRLETDGRFRADVASLLRATLYQERERIGHEDLLGILVAAAAGTEHDLDSEAQEADIREMLRFVLQSRRSTFHPEPGADEAAVTTEPEPRESDAVDSEPALRARGPQSAAQSMKLELKPDPPAVAVEKSEIHESGDVVLPVFRTAGLFAAHAEPEARWWRVHSVWVVGVVCMLVGVGLGLVFHRVVSAAETQAAVRAARSSSQPKISVPVAPAAAGVTQTASVTDDQKVVQPAVPAQVGVTAAPGVTEKGSGVPMTVVKQVVTASRSAASDSVNQTETTPSNAKTRSIVPQGLAGITPANVIFSPAPEYPAAAAAARVHGQVTVHAVVDPDGNVIYAHAVSGPPLLRDAAEQAVHRWRYNPLLDNGKPIAVTTTAIVDFKFAR